MLQYLMTLILVTGCAMALGCGHPTEDCQGTGFRSIVADGPDFKCYELQFVAEKNVEVMVAAGIATREEIMATRAHTDLHIVSTEIFDKSMAGNNLRGYTRWLEGITLGSGPSIVVLLHEELHNLQIDRWVADTYKHGNWEPEGYFAVTDFVEWWMAGRDFGRECDKDRTLRPEQRAGLIAAGWPVERWEQDYCGQQEVAVAP